MTARFSRCRSWAVRRAECEDPLASHAGALLRLESSEASSRYLTAVDLKSLVPKRQFMPALYGADVRPLDARTVAHVRRWKRGGR